MEFTVVGNNHRYGVKDVPADVFIRETAKELKRFDNFEVPVFMEFVKSGASRENSPVDPDFYYTRAASILRKLVLKGKCGVGLLRREYGQAANNGVAPAHRALASGKVIRHCLIQLRAVGFVEFDTKTNKRQLTPRGLSALCQVAKRCL